LEREEKIALNKKYEKLYESRNKEHILQVEKQKLEHQLRLNGQKRIEQDKIDQVKLDKKNKTEQDKRKHMKEYYLTHCKKCHTVIDPIYNIYLCEKCKH
jgi:hypothetical protein